MDIKQLEEIMITYGIVIRAIPEKRQSVFETRHITSYPSGKIKFLEKYNREMLIVEEHNNPKYAKKFIVECASNTDRMVAFYHKQPFDSIEDAVNYVLGHQDEFAIPMRYEIE